VDVGENGKKMNLFLILFQNKVKVIGFDRGKVKLSIKQAAI
jgi:hypothetical protein